MYIYIAIYIYIYHMGGPGARAACRRSVYTRGGSPFDSAAVQFMSDAVDDEGGSESTFLTFVDCKRKLNRTMAVTPSVVYTGFWSMSSKKIRGPKVQHFDFDEPNRSSNHAAGPPPTPSPYRVEAVCHWGRCVCRMVFKGAQQLQRLLQLRPAGAGLLHGV